VQLIEGTDNKDNVPFMYNRIGACMYAEIKYQEALVYFDKANVYAVMCNDSVIECIALYNMAMCYRRLLWLDKAIEYADLFIEKTTVPEQSDQYIYAHMVKINCYADKKDYNMMLTVSQKLINELEDKEGVIAAHIYNNMGNCYSELMLYDKSLEYYNKSEKIRREKELNKLCHTLIDKAHLYIKQNLYIEAEEQLQKGIELAAKYNDYDYILRGYNALIGVYEGIQSNEKIESTYEKIIKLLMKRSPEELKKTYLEISKFYIELGKLDKADEFLKLSQEEM
jgi:tetratricopeptide (TPR) repeat protein